MVVLHARLVESELWYQFHCHQNEMIITKAGRCLFPLYRLAFHSDGSERVEEDIVVIEISPERHYRVAVTIESVDDNKWKYRQGRWTPLLTSRALGQCETAPRTVLFQDRQLGSEILLNGLNFEKLKLTNRESNSPLSICLQSFHRYIPVTIISECEEPFLKQRISFSETEFVAVTHYQNEQVTLLKKSYNPHAKGFVLSDEPSVRGTVNWMLTPDTPSSPILDKRRRIRKRVRPIHSLGQGPTSSIPSDEEELQGSIALQLLSSSHPKEPVSESNQ
jgi:hypothetical protein